MNNPDPKTDLKTMPALASVSGYAAWRAAAELRLDGWVRSYWEKRNELDKLNRDISDLRNVMANGASGGTAWTLHNSRDQRPGPQDA